MACALCSGACVGADLTPVVTEELSWLWTAVAHAADRRGDPDMTSGTVTVRTPADPAARSAAVGLISRRPLSAGHRVRVDLASLTATLSRVARGLTPGAVAAHATGRPLALKALERETLQNTTAAITAHLRTMLLALPPHVGVDPSNVIERLSRTGWIARIRNSSDPEGLVNAAVGVLTNLPEPGTRRDRRTLVPGDPHALDSGVLPSLVLAIMGVANQRPREAWAEVGVDIDDLVGGLIVTGVAPAGWLVPAGATMTLPPKELTSVTWQSPAATDNWVFVTENPSVLSAALQAFQSKSIESTAHTPRVVCTVGTPSQIECNAIAALHKAGWQVAIRADFDPAGLAHVRALLAAAPTALPWRMSSADYVEARGDGGVLQAQIPKDAAPWDTELAAVMNEFGTPAYEEDLLPRLVYDILNGTPGKIVPGQRTPRGRAE